MKNVIILQARMTSTRLPGKILMPLSGKPLLAYGIERLQRIKKPHHIVVATTTNWQDDAVETLCNTLNVCCYRGNEHDVLDRYYQAAKKYPADAIIRVTGDCPLIDAHIVDLMLDAFESSNADYLSNTLTRTFPRGLDVEIFTATALQTAFKEATQPEEREHVTPYVYNHPECFRLVNYSQQNDYSQERWTVDTPEDFALIEKIIESLYPSVPNFTQEAVIALLDQQPEWRLLNAHIEQVKLSLK
jgi:spore coat polysaccharide biosynthesis protein SpsF